MGALIEVVGRGLDKGVGIGDEGSGEGTLELGPASASCAPGSDHWASFALFAFSLATKMRFVRCRILTSASSRALSCASSMICSFALARSNSF